MTEFHNLFILSSIYLTAVIKPVIGISCPETIPTVSYVPKCPSNETEWKLAAKKKSCHNLSKIQNCTSAENFVYHCVLNKDATLFLEVCAPPWYMSGFCARFSIADQRIVNNPGLDCTKFVQSCPTRFQSNESYKYQMCYKYIRDKEVHGVLKLKQSEENDSSATATSFAVFFGVILVVIFLILFISYKNKWLRLKKPLCQRGNEETGASELLMEDPGKQNQDTEKNNQKNEESGKNIENRPPETEHTLEDHINDEDDITTERPDTPSYEDEELMEFETMTGKTGECSVKGVTNIAMLREKLSKKLQFPKEIILVVVKEDGIIYNDDTEFEALKKHQSKIQLVIGKKDRIVHDPELDVISGKPLLTRNCKMSCGHFTAPETAFEYTKDKLTKGESVVLCRTCKKKWEMSELVQKCDMSRDEKIFLEHLMSLNLLTDLQYKT